MSTDRFDELLPWYVNGTLSDEDRAWVERHLAEHPDARAELDWYQSLQYAHAGQRACGAGDDRPGEGHAPDPGRPADDRRAHQRVLRRLRHAPGHGARPASR